MEIHSLATLLLNMGSVKRPKCRRAGLPAPSGVCRPVPQASVPRTARVEKDIGTVTLLPGDAGNCAIGASTWFPQSTAGRVGILAIATGHA